MFTVDPKFFIFYLSVCLYLLKAQYNSRMDRDIETNFLRMFYTINLQCMTKSYNFNTTKNGIHLKCVVPNT